MNSQLQRMVGAAAVTLAVSLTVAAQACASGGAGVYPNDRPGPLGVGSGGSFVAVVTSGAFGRAVLRADRPLYPDDRAGLRWHGDSGVVRFSLDDRAGLRWHGDSGRIGIYSDDRAGLRGPGPTLTLS
jgi:hypothetical protein